MIGRLFPSGGGTVAWPWVQSSDVRLGFSVAGAALICDNTAVPDSIESDTALARSWWSELAPQVPRTAAGLWFGIVDLAGNNEREAARHLYVAGTDSFDPTDDTGDWACDPVWLTGANYVLLPALAALPDAPYEAQLAHAVAVVRELRPQTTSPDSLQGVAVGVDDGDFEVTWVASDPT
ncbi:MAG TPA: hypothetical protein DEG43_06355 [Acidimicrobiaceae bacterium]|nr:hypothetical protein [Acidimicrobiaceae bacterium]